MFDPAYAILTLLRLMAKPFKLKIKGALAAMAFDFKKEYKAFYMPPNKPELIDVPLMNYLAVRGKGDPNQPEGEYHQAVSALYAVAFTLKMSYRGSRQIAGFYDYVVPPLEGFWWQEGADGFDYRHKELFQWLSVIRLPDFITAEDVQWAVAEASRKKAMDCGKVAFTPLCEGLCVQMTHLGPFDDEPASVRRMDAYIEEMGYQNDFSDQRLHHEIYLSDARRVEPARWKTVIRHPVKKRDA